MTPSQATEAWLSWGREDEAGRPPRGTVAKAETLTTELIAQMEANDDWPMTLRWFVNRTSGRRRSPRWRWPALAPSRPNGPAPLIDSLPPDDSAVRSHWLRVVAGGSIPQQSFSEVSLEQALALIR